MLEVRLLGSFHIQCGKKTVEITSRPAQSLFAYLILNAGTAFRREKLAGQLWPDSTEESARDYLRHALWRIRRALADASAASYLKANDLTIEFDASKPYWLDAAALVALDGKSSPGQVAKAIDAYAGELLPGFYEEWVVLERNHLQSAYEQQVARLLEMLQAQGQWAAVLQRAEKWIALGQRPEAAHRYLMSAHAAQGDMAKAAGAYERCVASLAELGVEPSEQTRHQYEEIKAGRTNPSSPKHQSVPTIAEKTKTNLPALLTSFIGREKELGEIVRLLRTQRLLTLVGPGGVGKTRLAIESGKRVLSKFNDGVFWVELIGLNDPALVPQAVVQAAKIPESAGRSGMDALKDYFGGRQSLIVLDNCEHLIMGCSQMASQLLSACPGIRILATSREALDVLGEAAWTVPSLTLPSSTDAVSAKSLSTTESVRLFLERVSSPHSRFELTDENAAAIAKICTRLSGIPLAIELAAARVKMMSVDEIARRLEDSLNLLNGGNRGALPRHQTLRATIDWSYELLSEQERVLFRRLAIFADGFTLEAVETVAPDEILPQARVTDLLGLLVSKSLVSVVAGSGASETRYRMLETIRQYAHERLGAAAEFRVLKKRHLAFFAAFAKRAERGIYSAEQARWFQQLDTEADNLRTALDWSSVRDQQNAASLLAVRKDQFTIICSLVMYWERAYRREIAQAAGKLLDEDRGSAITVERARALYAAGFLWWSLYDFSLARSCLEESIAISENLSDPLTLAWGLGYLGWTLSSLGEYGEARGFLERAVKLAQSLGNAGDQAAVSAMSFLGDIPYWSGDLAEARRLYSEAIAFTRELHNINTMTFPLRRLGYVALRQGNPEEAAGLFSASLQNNQQLKHVPGMTACIAGFAAMELAGRRYQSAALLCGCVEVLLERFGAPFFMADKVEFERTVASLKEQMRLSQFHKAWMAGRIMQLDQAIDFALKRRQKDRRRQPGPKAATEHTRNTRSKHA